MNIVIAILSGTPWWVFALLALLVGLGVQQLKPRVVRLPRIAVVPGVFLAWGLIALSTRAAVMPDVVLAWLIASMLGVGLGWSTTRLDGIRVDRRRGLIYLPDGWTTLVVSLSVFAAKYALAVSAALRPQWHAAIATADVAVSGLSAGYFLARLARLLIWYRHSSQVDLAIAGLPR
jgi:hypothetical protein